MRGTTRLAAACAAALALGAAPALAGMKPATVTGKVETVQMGKHAFSLSALHMQLIFTNGKTKWVGIKGFEAVKHGQKLRVTVLHEGTRYTAVRVAKA